MRETVYGHQKRLRFFVEEIRALAAARRCPPGDIRILDVGCGTGVMVTRPLAALGYDVTGLDTDLLSIDQAWRLNKEPRHLPNLRYVVGALGAEHTGPPFDVIICSEVLEHLPDPRALLRLALERLTDDGIVLITVPNGFGLFEVDSHLWEALSKVPGFWRLPDLWLRLKYRLLDAFGRGAAARAAAADEDHPDRVASLAQGQPHCQFFTRGRALRLFEASGLRLARAGRSSLWAGPIAHLLLRDFGALVRLDCALADRLPPFLAAGFYFSLRKSEVPGTPVAAMPPVPAVMSSSIACA